MKSYASHYSDDKTLYFITKYIIPRNESKRLIDFKKQANKAIELNQSFVI